MSDCATSRMRFETQTPLALEAAFDGGRITSDGGLLWLAQTDSQLGLCEAISEHVPEWRKRKGCHSLSSLVRQRVFQIACGYEDQRTTRTPCQETPCSSWCAALCPRAERISQASPPSRAWRTRRGRSLLSPNSPSVPRTLPPRARQRRRSGEGAIGLRCDRRDPTHAEQEGSHYHGYYEQHVYHPLLVFDGESGHLICALS